MNDYFETFIREKTYLQGLTDRSIRHYRESWKAFKRYKGEITPQGVKEFMMNMIASGMKPGAANAFARGSTLICLGSKKMGTQKPISKSHSRDSKSAY